MYTNESSGISLEELLYCLGESYLETHRKGCKRNMPLGSSPKTESELIIPLLWSPNAFISTL